MEVVGTIVPFYGDPNWLAGTDWVLCDGGPIPANADQRLVAFLRAQSPQGSPFGHLPNLCDGRFLRGTSFYAPDHPERVGAIGGKEAIPEDGAHIHPQTDSQQPTPLFLQAGRPYGYHFRAAGGHTHGGENRPPFMNVLYIMKYR